MTAFGMPTSMSKADKIGAELFWGHLHYFLMIFLEEQIGVLRIETHFLSQAGFEHSWLRARVVDKMVFELQPSS